jgi:hypothetical protein
MRLSINAIVFFFCCAMVTPARASFHLWQMNELYSSPDGAVQYLELTALGAGQQFLVGHTIRTGNGFVTNSFTFPSNLPGDTAGRRMLIATQGFASLQFVQPDYIVPDGFFSTIGGTIDFAEGSDLWSHPSPPSPPLALNRNGSTATNSPQNFAGQGGTVPADPPRLLNMSTRMQVLTGDNVMIAGFALGGQGGTSAKTLVIRAAGPSLANAGILNPLQDPKLTLIRTTQNLPQVLAINDNWASAANASQIQASGFAPSHPLEPAIMITLGPGTYTAVVEGANRGGTGIALVGLFEVDHTEAQFLNVSTRGNVLTDDGVMIAGFIVEGGAKTVVVNVAGPSLVSAGINAPLANPTLTLVRSADNSIVATNDDWQTQTNPADVTAINNSGFKPNHSLEPAIIATLQPGAYTAIVSGVAGGTGVGVVGVFVVP